MTDGAIAQKEIPDYIISLFEACPYPIQIFSRDGTSRLINDTGIEMLGIKSRENHVGKYNVFEDPLVRKLGVTEQIRQVLKGKTVYLTDFTASYADMMRYYDVRDMNYKFIISDITCYPLKNVEGEITHFAAIFIFKNIILGKEEIGQGIEYIKKHWKDPFNADDVAKAVHLSKSHFTKLFKTHIGVTPYEYYISYKINKLKELLMDTNLTISQAFSACNMSYSGHSARMFKDKVGLTPSEYRKKMHKD